MAIERSIAKGDKLLEDKDYLGAIESYSAAINENPKAFKAYLKRAIAYQRFKNYDRAKTDVSEAFALAQERGKRQELAECYFRLGIIYYSEKSLKLALINFKKAEAYGCQESALSTWILKAQTDVKKEDPDFKWEDSEEEPKKEAEKAAISPPDHSTSAANPPESDPKEVKSTSIDTINKHAPLKPKIRDDWYQTNDEVIITIYAKNVNPDTLSIEYHDSSVSVLFPNGAGSEYNYNLDPLYSPIDPRASHHVVKTTKIEITLVKTDKTKWPSLEAPNNNNNSSEQSREPGNELSAAPLSYPTSARKTINWANFNLEDDEDDAQQNENDFFAKLYKDTDDDTRKAMMKSFTESNGTVLTTDWTDAKEKTFEPSPPEGMEPKKWQ